MRKIILAASALALAIAVSPTSGSQAASLLGPGSKAQTDSLLTQAKAKKHRMHRKGHRHASKGPGRCGENMYWSGKHHHCMDARNKA